MTTQRSSTTAIPVEHPAWKDSLHFHDDLFHREDSGCTGRFEILPDGSVLLKWDSWRPEILTTSGNILSLDEYAGANEAAPVDLAETWTMEATRAPQVCIFTFSRERLHFLCSLIACMKAQTEADFIHVIHSIGYSGEQNRFIKQMIGEDSRFVLREVVAMSQKKHLRHILADARRFDAPFCIKTDDDDIYTPQFLKTIIKEAKGHDLTAGISLLVHETGSHRSFTVPRSPQFGNNMCFSRRAVDHLLSIPDDSTRHFEDAFAHHSLDNAGFKIHTFETQQPPILYLRHGGNISRLRSSSEKTQAQPDEHSALSPAAPGLETSSPRTAPGTIAVFTAPAQLGLPHLDEFVRHNPSVPIHVMPLPELEGDALQHAWRSSDGRILQWWDEQGRHLDFNHVLFLEWDVLFAKPVDEVFPDNAHFYCKEVVKPGMPWVWFNEFTRLPEELRAYATGIPPLAILRISRECLAATFNHPLRAKLYEDDIFCELRLPTLAAACGYEPVACPRTLPQVECHPVDAGTGSGVWHAVKSRRTDAP